MDKKQMNEPIFKYSKKSFFRKWFQKRKQQIIIGALGLLLAAEGIWAYKRYDLLQETVNNAYFRQATTSDQPRFVLEDEEKEKLEARLKEFEPAKNELMAGNSSEFTFYQNITHSDLQYCSWAFLTAGKFRYNKFCFITPDDSNKKFEISGEMTVENLVSNNLVRPPKLVFAPATSDIFSPKASIEEIVIDGKPIDKKFIKTGGEHVCLDNNCLPSFYVDLGELVREEVLTSSDFEDCGLKIRYTAVIDTEEYKQIAPEDAGTMEDLMKHQKYTELIDPEKWESPSTYPVDDSIIQHIASVLKQGKTGPLEIARACYDFTQRVLEYNKDSKVPPVQEIIVRGDGKCIDYANVMITLLLACGIPAKEPQLLGAVGTKEGELKGWHAWVEFLVPLKNGEFKWILSEPTWGDNNEKERYFQCTDEGDQKTKHFYWLNLDVLVENAYYSSTHTQQWKIEDKNK